MDTNISMQQLKEQRITPAEKFVLDKIKGAKQSAPAKDGSVWWYKDGKYLFTQSFTSGYLYVSLPNIWTVLVKDYGFSYDETQELVTKLLYKYTNNGQLKVIC